MPDGLCKEILLLRRLRNGTSGSLRLPGLRFWAFVNVTNNETQHVTTITPQ